MITTRGFMRVALALAAVLACCVLGCDADVLGLGTRTGNNGWALLMTPSLDAACRKKEFNQVWRFIGEKAALYPHLQVVETTSNIDRKPEILLFENKQERDDYTVSGSEKTQEQIVALLESLQAAKATEDASEGGEASSDDAQGGAAEKQHPYIMREVWQGPLWTATGGPEGLLSMMGIHPEAAAAAPEAEAAEEHSEL